MSDVDKLDAIIGRFIQATDAARNRLVDELRAAQAPDGAEGVAVYERGFKDGVLVGRNEKQ